MKRMDMQVTSHTTFITESVFRLDYILKTFSRKNVSNKKARFWDTKHASLCLNVGLEMVPDIHTFHQEKRVFGDICRVVRDTLQVPGDQDQIDGLWDDGGVLLHEFN